MRRAKPKPISIDLSDSATNKHLDKAAGHQLRRSQARGLETESQRDFSVVMKRDPFESAIDAILASADGDVQRALRAMLGENIELESELRSLYAASEHGKFADTKNSLH